MIRRDLIAIEQLFFLLNTITFYADKGFGRVKCFSIYWSDCHFRKDRRFKSFALVPYKISLITVLTTKSSLNFRFKSKQTHFNQSWSCVAHCEYVLFLNQTYCTAQCSSLTVLCFSTQNHIDPLFSSIQPTKFRLRKNFIVSQLIRRKLQFIFSFFSVLFASLFVSSFAYPDVRIDFSVPGWSATGRTIYAACRQGQFDITYGNYHVEWRGECLLTEIQADVHGDGKTIRARPYKSSGTGYSQFEIVREDGDDFCIRRVGTSCWFEFHGIQC